jgi:bifunctional DNA-binding transcriptional regulator/antitoxin component of YhaV-PrlF toxin-antitoxin module
MATNRRRTTNGAPKGRAKRLHDARSAYATQERAADERLVIPLMRSRISAKNQITLPVAMTRRLDWRPGDEVSLMIYDDLIVLTRLPRTPEEWTTWLAGSIDYPEWRTKESIDAWLKSEREGWEREYDWQPTKKDS